MFTMTKLAALLLITQASFVGMTRLQAGDVEEEISCLNPLFYDDANSFAGEDNSEQASKIDSSKNTSQSPECLGKIGNARVTVDVENTDFLSQCQAEWDSIQKNNPKKKKRSSLSDEKNDDEKKDDHSPKVSASIKWSTER